MMIWVGDGSYWVLMLMGCFPSLLGILEQLEMGGSLRRN